LSEFARGGLINIAGGCCGNTPEHMAAIAKGLEGQPPRRLPQSPHRATPAGDGVPGPVLSEVNR
jgi:5-methyltetrahydrofolate--homocysteine methyltransferase